MASFVVDQEVMIRTLKMYDQYRRRLSFYAVLTDVGETSVSANIQFNGITLQASGIPIQMISELPTYLED